MNAKTSKEGMDESATDTDQKDTPVYDAWLANADKIKLEDPLLECLVILARENGRKTSLIALTSGLPLSQEGFASPALFVRAANRVDMSAKLVKRPLRDLSKSPSLPCILILERNVSCILRSVKDDYANITLPERPNETISVKISELESSYKGYAFFLSRKVKLDARAGPNKNLGSRHWFWSTIFRHKRVYAQVVIATVFINILALVSPIYIMNVYDRVLPNNAFDTLIVLATGATLAMVFDFILKNIRAHFLDAAGRKSDIRISSKIFEHILNVKIAERPASSGVLADNMREFETLRDFFTSATVTTLIDLPFAFFFIFLIYIIGGALAIVPLAVLFAIIVFGLILQKPMGRAINENMREGAFKSSLLIETINGLETIKGQASESYTQRKWEDIVEKSSETSLKTRFISSLGVNFTNLMAGLSAVYIAFYGVYLAASGSISAGALIACVILSGRVIAPLAQFANILTRFNHSKMALSRLDDLMVLPLERQHDASYISQPILKGEVVFKNVDFSYPNIPNKTLNQFSIHIHEGDCVGVIGAVGCGKTTLHRLLLNLYQPQSGLVEIDGLNVGKIEPGDLRRNIGIAQQDAYFFYGSVRDNITMGNETVTEAAIARAANLSGLEEFMIGSTSGLDTQVGERGHYLSGGQRQAIAIARALLYDPPILILDEPTASIDPKSEKVLYERLVNLKKNKTVIIITHKTILLGLVDKIALMDQGQILDYGPKDKIIKGLRSGKYTYLQPPKG